MKFRVNGREGGGQEDCRCSLLTKEGRVKMGETMISEKGFPSSRKQLMISSG